MIALPKTRAEAAKYRYGTWGGNPLGEDWDPRYCAYEVPMDSRSPLFRQCRKRPGLGPDGLYCGTHAKKVG